MLSIAGIGFVTGPRPRKINDVILHDIDTRGFASDNYSGVHPDILTAIADANHGHQSSYGADVYTERLGEVFRTHFGPDARAYPVLTGTGANVIALQALTARWGAVICADSGHVHTDEGGAPEKTGGLKLLPVPTVHGKLTVEAIRTQSWGFDDPHRARPQVVSLAQATELGTVYTPEEIRAICEYAHGHGMSVHMDGSRLANAAARLGVPLRALTTDAGVDVLSFGGTKNGMLLGEAVVLLDPALDPGIDRLRKTSMQLASKQRFVAAQFLALLENDLWLRNAAHANAMADLLSEGLRDLPEVTVIHPVQSNALFVRLPEKVLAGLHDDFAFYDWGGTPGEARWMTSFDTTAEDVEAVLSLIRSALLDGRHS
ncbi:threonine aldolase family protein [Actinoplanes couchii]|uniref:Threonine aldolase n=1 Tax=Actinoplanes couchii TaxID=403638 RepID=A0ABQ3XDV7_9ACTN|nr:low specificity L-threonine aldolase [Actinoplanes couchii]MDR6317166.1 threonine aldolase [Actinoplanes couchii]GID56660.1 threonine aldolase [Actinoplanes couchii]